MRLGRGPARPAGSASGIGCIITTSPLRAPPIFWVPGGTAGTACASAAAAEAVRKSKLRRAIMVTISIHGLLKKPGKLRRGSLPAAIVEGMPGTNVTATRNEKTDEQYSRPHQRLHYRPDHTFQERQDRRSRVPQADQLADRGRHPGPGSLRHHRRIAHP